MNNVTGEAPASSVTLRSSKLGIFRAAVGTLALIGLTIYTLSSTGLTIPGVLLGLLTVAGVWVMLFDYPLSSTLHASGVERRLIARRQSLPFDESSRLRRPFQRPSLTGRRRPPGPLELRQGRKRVMLTDCLETPEQFELLQAVVAVADKPGAHVGLDAVESPAVSYDR